MTRISILCHEYGCVEELGFVDLDGVDADELAELAAALGGDPTRDSLEDLELAGLPAPIQALARRLLRVLSDYYCEACVPIEEAD